MRFGMRQTWLRKVDKRLMHPLPALRADLSSAAGEVYGELRNGG